MRTPERAWGRGRGSWTSYLMTFPGSQLSPQPACSPGRELHGGCARLLPATAASWKDRARPAWTHSSWRTAVEESDAGRGRHTRQQSKSGGGNEILLTAERRWGLTGDARVLRRHTEHDPSQMQSVLVPPDGSSRKVAANTTWEHWPLSQGRHGRGPCAPTTAFV